MTAHVNSTDAIQVICFYHGPDDAGDVVEALLGGKRDPEYKARRNRCVRRSSEVKELTPIR